MRTFIAVAPQTEVRNHIDTLQRSLAEKVQAAGLPNRLLAWSPVEKMHLTLRFLGESTAGQRALLEAGLQAIGARHAPLTLELGGVGVFPDWRKPTVVWLGIARSSALLALQAEVEQLAQAAGFAAEARACKPHLTLARTSKQARPDDLLRLGEALRMAGQKPALASWRVPCAAESVELMRSELLPGGARYSVLACVALKGEVTGSEPMAE